MRRAIEQCLQTYWGQLFGYAVFLGGDRETARDLLQASAERALASPALPRDADAIRAWLYRIIRNVWIDHFRKTRVRSFEPPAEALGRDGWSFEDRLIAEITVQQGLARIETAHREVIELVDLAGFAYAEAAEILDVPVGTVMSRLSRARLALLHAIETGSVRALDPVRRRRSP